MSTSPRQGRTVYVPSRPVVVTRAPSCRSRLRVADEPDYEPRGDGHEPRASALAVMQYLHREGCPWHPDALLYAPREVIAWAKSEGLPSRLPREEMPEAADPHPAAPMHMAGPPHFVPPQFFPAPGLMPPGAQWLFAHAPGPTATPWQPPMM